MRCKCSFRAGAFVLLCTIATNDLEMACVTLTFDPLSWNLCCMYATYQVIWSNKGGATERTGPKLETTRVTLSFDLSSWKLSATHRPLICCMCATYKVIRPNKEEATARTRQKLQMIQVTFISNGRCDLDLAPFDLEMDRYSSSWHRLYLCQV